MLARQLQRNGLGKGNGQLRLFDGRLGRGCGERALLLRRSVGPDRELRRDLSLII